MDDNVLDRSLDSDLSNREFNKVGGGTVSREEKENIIGMEDGS